MENDATTSVGFNRHSRLPNLASRMAVPLPTRTTRLAIILLVLGWLALCALAPWRQVHPSDNSLVHALSRAPLWTNHYRALPGAQVNVAEFLLEGCLVLSAALLLRAYGTRSNPKPH
jgi:hypothetical protein